MNQKRKILLILGHPDPDSLNGALFDAYAEGAQSVGLEPERLVLSRLSFNPILAHGYRQRTELEPDLLNAWKSIQAADHVVLFYPTWWGTVPALLKAFFERLFLPGFAFHYRKDSPFPEQLLKGRSARLVVTMDAPAWYDRLFYGAASRRAIRRNILEYCGIRPVRTTVFDRIRNRSEKERSRMIEQMRSLGAQLA